MVKGSYELEPGAAIQEMVRQLDVLAGKRFPIDEVRTALEQMSCALSDLEPYVFYSIEYYTRNLIYHSPLYELVLLCWMPGQKTPIHGHEGEKCWMRVIDGSLQVSNYSKASPLDGGGLKQDLVAQVPAGSVEGPFFTNQVANITDHKSISLHLYARPFYECDVFEEMLSTKKRMNLSFFSMFGKIVRSV